MVRATRAAGVAFAVAALLSATGCEAWSAAPADVVVVDETAAVRSPTATPSPTQVVEVVKEVPVDAHPHAPSPCYPRTHKSEIPPASSLQWSPDGADIFFATDAAEVYAVAADGSRLRRLATAWAELSPGIKVGRETPFQVAPDSTRLVYATCEYLRPRAGTQPDGWDFRHELVLADLDGTQGQRLTTSASFESYPTWSPDGSRIAFVSSDWVSVARPLPSSERSTRLYLMQADGTDPQMLARGLDFIVRQPPSWSPDGRWLAVTGISDDQEWIAARRENRRPKSEGRLALFLIDASTGRESLRLSDAVSGASWSPDGQRLAFARLDDSELALYTIAADGTDAQRVTTIEGWRSWWPSYMRPSISRTWVPLIAWSPDGSKILYSCDGICVVDLDGTSVGNAPLPGILAAWSPDGSRIAILDNKQALSSVAPDGSDVQVLVVAALGGPIAAKSGNDDLASNQAACTAGVVVRVPTDNPGLVRDCEVLMSLEGALFGGTTVNWGPGIPIADWVGVTVSGAPLRVTGLTLHRLKLTGPLPPALGELTQLRLLDLSYNKLTGPLPPALGELTQLRVLNLSYNEFTGPLPPALGDLTQLQVLLIRGGTLTGTIEVRGGMLTGGIPAELGQLANLRLLGLAGNQLTGGIPADLGQLTNLLALDLSENKLSGALPAELGQLTNLTGVTELHVPDRYAALVDQLTTSLAGEIGEIDVLLVARWEQMINLLGLSIHTNQLTGPIPPELGQLTQLVGLDLHNNQLTGAIPPELGQLTILKELDLAGNHLSGAIPAALSQLSHLTLLRLQENQLTGTIPAALSRLVSLRTLSLQDNQLTGAIPPELGQLVLSALYLGGNPLTGCIPPALQRVQANDLPSLERPYCKQA